MPISRCFLPQVSTEGPLETIDKWGQEFIEMEVMPDHVHLLMGCDPQFGIHRLVKYLKGTSSRLLRQEFPDLKRKLPSLWTNSYFVATTGGVTLEQLKRYVEGHKESMKKAFKYRIYPTNKQTRILNEWLALCCETYNSALDERESAYRMAGISISYSHQCAELPGCKEVRPELAEVHSQVLQDALKRVDRAFEGFFRRVEAGEKAGYPRFKSRFRYDSLTFKQYGNSFSFSQDGKLVLSKIGHVKIVLHRAIKGIPKTATVSRSSTGKWYVSISCDEVGPVVLQASSKRVGVDVGLKTFAYLSDGTTIENPRFLREEENVGKSQACSRGESSLEKRGRM